MPRPAKFTISRSSGTSPWSVNIPAAYSETGRRVRLFFASEELARAEQARRTRSKNLHGTSRSVLPPDVAADAERARKLLDPCGATLTAAAKAFLAASDTRGKSLPLRAVVGEFLESLERRRKSQDYLRNVRFGFGKLASRLGDKLVCDISTRNLRDALKKETPAVQSSVKRHLRPAFQFAIAHGYAKENPFVHFQPDEAPQRSIEILTPEQAEKLLKHATEDVRPYLTLALFCGIRPKELVRLDWSAVKRDREWVEVARDASKTRRRRFVELSKNALALLEPWREATGPIVPLSHSAR